MFEQLLQSRSSIILDGGLATELESRGVRIDTELWSAAILKSEPQAIINAHRAYLAKPQTKHESAGQLLG